MALWPTFLEKSVKTLLEILGVVAFLVTGVLSMFWLMEERHANKTELIAVSKKLLVQELEIREEILDRDIKKNAEARVYYKDLEKEKALGHAEMARLQYIEEQLSRKYTEQEKIQDRLYDLEKNL